jgi:hypothetical protein
VLSLKRERCTIIIFVENLLSDSPTRDSNNLHVGENTNMGGVYFFVLALVGVIVQKRTLHHYCFNTKPFE